MNVFIYIMTNSKNFKNPNAILTPFFLKSINELFLNMIMTFFKASMSSYIHFYGSVENISERKHLFPVSFPEVAIPSLLRLHFPMAQVSIPDLNLILALA